MKPGTSSREPSADKAPEKLARAGYLLASLSALLVVTCAGAARSGKVAESPLPAPAVRPSASPLVPAPSQAAPAARTAPPSEKAHPWLGRFRGALAGLASGSRREPVRVLWMGDSHAAADFWPDAVRKPLQGKYGAGGPGFMFLGLGVYRHAGVKLDRDGKWHLHPRQPSLWMRQEDGVFGLGGIRAVADGKASVKLELQKDAVTGGASWDLAYRLPDLQSALRVVIAGGETLVLDSAGAPPGGIAHRTWKTPPGATVVVESVSGSPELFGAVVESTTPGVVVDTLGINGARIGTPLAWDEESWLGEARRRSASLFVLAYGTNEVGDAVAPEKYGPELTNLIARVRRSAPDADCLVIGPTDRGGPDFMTLPRVSEVDLAEQEAAELAGCVYWSAFRAMGGEGSLKRWASEAPPLAASDHVHLTPRGYGELGALVAGVALGEPVAPEPSPRL